jgi:hypothetical protein
LVPDSKNVDVTAQRRDGDQTSLTINHVVRPETEPPYWLFGSAGVAGCVIALTRRREGRSNWRDRPTFAPSELRRARLACQP